MSHQLAIQRLTGSTEASVTSLGDQYFRLKAMLGQTRAQQEALCGQVLSKYKGSVLLCSLYKVHLYLVPYLSYRVNIFWSSGYDPACCRVFTVSLTF